MFCWPWTFTVTGIYFGERGRSYAYAEGFSPRLTANAPDSEQQAAIGVPGKEDGAIQEVPGLQEVTPNSISQEGRTSFLLAANGIIDQPAKSKKEKSIATRNELAKTLKPPAKPQGFKTCKELRSAVPPKKRNVSPVKKKVRFAEEVQERIIPANTSKGTSSSSGFGGSLSNKSQPIVLSVSFIDRTNSSGLAPAGDRKSRLVTQGKGKQQPYIQITNRLSSKNAVRRSSERRVDNQTNRSDISNNYGKPRLAGISSSKRPIKSAFHHPGQMGHLQENSVRESSEPIIILCSGLLSQRGVIEEIPVARDDENKASNSSSQDNGTKSFSRHSARKDRSKRGAWPRIHTKSRNKTLERGLQRDRRTKAFYRDI